MADFGAFVDFGGIDGLIHNSELSYARIKHPSEVVKIGDVVHVEIMKFDPDAKKVSLSLKHALPDPWDSTPTDCTKPISSGPNREGDAELPAWSKSFRAFWPWFRKASSTQRLSLVAGQEVEVTLLTINHATRRITASIEHVADIPIEEIEQLVVAQSTSPPDDQRRSRLLPRCRTVTGGASGRYIPS